MANKKYPDHTKSLCYRVSNGHYLCGSFVLPKNLANPEFNVNANWVHPMGMIGGRQLCFLDRDSYDKFIAATGLSRGSLYITKEVIDLVRLDTTSDTAVYMQKDAIPLDDTRRVSSIIIKRAQKPLEQAELDGDLAAAMLKNLNQQNSNNELANEIANRLEKDGYISKVTEDNRRIVFTIAKNKLPNVEDNPFVGINSSDNTLNLVVLKSYCELSGRFEIICKADTSATSEIRYLYDYETQTNLSEYINKYFPGTSCNYGKYPVGLSYYEYRDKAFFNFGISAKYGRSTKTVDKIVRDCETYIDLMPKAIEAAQKIVASILDTEEL